MSGLNYAINSFQSNTNRATVEAQSMVHVMAALRDAQSLAPFACSKENAPLLESVGIPISPFAAAAHSHPASKALENQALQKVVPNCIHGEYTIVSTKETKALRFSRGVAHPGYLLNPLVTSTDVTRYARTHGRTAFGIDTEWAFFHDVLQYATPADIADIFESAPALHTIIATAVIPVESLCNGRSWYPTLYDIHYLDGLVVWAPDGHFSESYVQPLAARDWLRISTIYSKSYVLKVTRVHSAFSHHVFSITRLPGLPESHRFFSTPDLLLVPSSVLPAFPREARTVPRSAALLTVNYADSTKSVLAGDVRSRLRSHLNTNKISMMPEQVDALVALAYSRHLSKPNLDFSYVLPRSFFDVLLRLTPLGIYYQVRALAHSYAVGRFAAISRLTPVRAGGACVEYHVSAASPRSALTDARDAAPSFNTVTRIIGSIIAGHRDLGSMVLPDRGAADNEPEPELPAGGAEPITWSGALLYSPVLPIAVTLIGLQRISRHLPPAYRLGFHLGIGLVAVQALTPTAAALTFLGARAARRLAASLADRACGFYLRHTDALTANVLVRLRLLMTRPEQERADDEGAASPIEEEEEPQARAGARQARHVQDLLPEDSARNGFALRTPPADEDPAALDLTPHQQVMLALRHHDEVWEKQPSLARARHNACELRKNSGGHIPRYSAMAKLVAILDRRPDLAEGSRALCLADAPHGFAFHLAESGLDTLSLSLPAFNLATPVHDRLRCENKDLLGMPILPKGPFDLITFDGGANLPSARATLLQHVLRLLIHQPVEGQAKLIIKVQSPDLTSLDLLRDLDATGYHLQAVRPCYCSPVATEIYILGWPDQSGKRPTDSHDKLMASLRALIDDATECLSGSEDALHAALEACYGHPCTRRFEEPSLFAASPATQPAASPAPIPSSEPTGPSERGNGSTSAPLSFAASIALVMTPTPGPDGPLGGELDPPLPAGGNAGGRTAGPTHTPAPVPSAPHPMPLRNDCLITALHESTGLSKELVWDHIAAAVPAPLLQHIARTQPPLDVRCIKAFCASSGVGIEVIPHATWRYTTRLFGPAGGRRPIHWRPPTRNRAGHWYTTPSRPTITKGELLKQLCLLSNSDGRSNYRARAARAKPLLRLFKDPRASILAHKAECLEDLAARVDNLDNGARRVHVGGRYGSAGSGKSFEMLSAVRRFMHSDEADGSTVTVILPRDSLRQAAKAVIEPPEPFGFTLSTHEQIFDNRECGSIVLLDEIGLFPPGYTDALLARFPNITHVFITGDSAQSMYHCRADSALAALRPEALHLLPYVKKYLLPSRRLGQLLGAQLSVPATVDAATGTGLHLRQHIDRRHPVLFLSNKKMLEYHDAGYSSYTYAGAQGLTLGVYQVVIERGDPICDDRLLWVALTRGHTCYLVNRRDSPASAVTDTTPLSISLVTDPNDSRAAARHLANTVPAALLALDA